MPMTLLHMGPGLAIKALAGRHFSLLSFGVAQVAIDIEPLIGFILDSDVLHGPTHTYLGALAIAAIVAVISPYLCRPILRRWNSELSFYHLDWLVTPESFKLFPVIAGACSGTISHVLLDSIMHVDITPLAPFSKANELQGIVTIDVLHQFCVLTGLFGIFGWIAVALWKRRVSCRVI